MVTIRFFGPIEFEVDGRAVALQSRKAAGVLAYLALTGERVSRPFLAEMFWSGQTERRGRANLSWVLNHLRKHLPGCLTADLGAIAFEETGVESDVGRFRLLAKEGTIPALEASAALARGELMAGFALDGCPEFELWLTAEREQWRQRAAEVMLRLVRGCRESGAYAAAIEHARRLLALAPWREAAHQELIRLLALTGHRSDALAQYEQCRRALAEELGVGPSAETERLAAQIEAGELKASLPPAATQRPLRPPQPATPFFGRTAELAEVERLLLSPGCRLLTILGIGGMGKTRLAIEAAHRLAGHFSDGAAFVSLAALDGPEQMAATIRGGVGFRPKEPENEPPEGQLKRFLAGKSLLLVLDNFEHLLGGVPLVLGILERCPGVTVLATSRARLNVLAETVLPLAGLVEEAGVADGDAVAMFLERAGRVQPGLQTTPADITEIKALIRSVGGHPLAIELAAAQLHTADIETVAAETAESVEALRVTYADFPERHHSIEAIFDRSWQSLPKAAKGALGRLSFCQAGCTPKAARMMTGVDRAVFGTLANQALIELADGRYQLHELVRQYARQQLGADGVKAGAARHAAYYLGWLVEETKRISGAEQGRVVEKIRAEFENVRRGWRWLFEDPEHLGALPVGLEAVCWGLYRFLARDGRYFEGDGFFGVAAEQASNWPEGEPAAAMLRAFGIILTPPDWLWERPTGAFDRAFLDMVEEAGREGEAALFHFALGYSLQLESAKEVDKDRCCFHLGEALRRYEGMGNWEQGAMVRFVLGRRLSMLGDYTAAIGQFNRCLDDFAGHGDVWGEARTLQRLGKIRYGLGEYAKAGNCFRRCRGLNQGLGFQPGVAFSTRWLGNVAFSQGDYEQAHARYLQALELEQEMGDLYQIGRCFNNLGAACKNIDEFEQAEHWYRESVAVFDGLENKGLAAMAYNNLGMLFEAQGRYGEALGLVEKGLKMRLEAGGGLSAVDDLINMGNVLTSLKEFERARSYLREALWLSLDGGREGLTLEALGVMARIHAEEERPERAARLATLVLNHPAASHLTREGAGSLIARLDWDGDVLMEELIKVTEVELDDLGRYGDADW